MANDLLKKIQNNQNAILTAKAAYNVAAKKKDKAAMDKAHKDADKARGYTTNTVKTGNGYVQSATKLTENKKQTPTLPVRTTGNPKLATPKPKEVKANQERNTQVLLKELNGKNGKTAAFIKGAALASVDPLGLHKLSKGEDPRVTKALEKKTNTVKSAPNASFAARGFAVPKARTDKVKVETLGEIAGSLAAVDVVGNAAIKGATKLGGKIINKLANKAATETIPVVKNGVVKFEKVLKPTKEATKDLKNVKLKAPIKGALPTKVTENPLPQAPINATQPVLPTKGTIPSKFKSKPAAIKKETQNISARMDDEYFKTVKSVEDYLNSYKPKGVDINLVPKNNDYGVEEFTRQNASKNDMWYQDFYKAHGRKPNKAELKELAEKLVENDITNPNGEFYNPALHDLIKESQGIETKTVKPLTENDLQGYENYYSNLKPKTVSRLEPLPRAAQPQTASPPKVSKADYDNILSGDDVFIRTVRTPQKDIQGRISTPAGRTGIELGFTPDGSHTGVSGFSGKDGKRLHEWMTHEGWANDNVAVYRGKKTGEQNVLDKGEVEFNPTEIIDVVPTKYFKEANGDIHKALELKAQATNQAVQPQNTLQGAKLPQAQKVAENAPNLPRFKDLGADTNRVLNSTKENVEKYGVIPEGEIPFRKVQVPKGTAYGETQQYARTLAESAMADEETVSRILDAVNSGNFAKSKKSNLVAVENANYELSNGLETATNKFKSVLLSDKTPKSDDIALGNRLMQEYQKSGDYAGALNIAEDLSQMLSESGRTLQAAQIAKRLTPEGRIRLVQNVKAKIEKNTKTKLNISNETLERIVRASGENDISESLQQASKELWDQVPATWRDKMNAWRYMSMLTNPKTHVRNVIGNALFVPARQLKNVIGAGIEKTIPVGERTKSVLVPFKDKELSKFASKDFENVRSILKGEGKLDQTNRALEAKVFNNRYVEGLRKFNMDALDMEDTMFMKTAYSQSLAQWAKANKINPSQITPVQLDKGRAYAMNEALKATYRDSNAFAEAIARVKTNLATSDNKWANAGGVVMEGALPFTKTPINILRRGLEYSPVGVVKGTMDALKNVKAGNMSASQAIDELAAGLSGTGIMALGAYLANQGLVTGAGENEKYSKADNFEKLQGSQNYSLKIGDTYYSIDWTAPVSMPLFVGVEISNALKKEGASFSDIVDSMTSIPDPLFNMSMLQGINNLVKTGYEDKGILKIAANSGLSYAGQFVPTFFGQVARTVDDTRRSNKSTSESPTARQLEKFGRQQLNKIPLASKLNEPYIDTWGRKEVDPSPLSRGLQNFISPGFVSKKNITKVDSGIQKIASGLDKETANKVYPRDTSSNVIIQNGIDYRMTEKELTVFNQKRGKESYNGLNTLFSSPEYEKADKEEKIKLIGKVYDSAFEEAKKEVLVSKGVYDEIATMSKGQKDNYNKYLKPLGVNKANFADTVKGANKIKSDKWADGSSMENASYKKKKYIDSANPKATKEQLKALYEAAGVSEGAGLYMKQFE